MERDIFERESWDSYDLKEDCSVQDVEEALDEAIQIVEFVNERDFSSNYKALCVSMLLRRVVKYRQFISKGIFRRVQSLVGKENLH